MTHVEPDQLQKVIRRESDIHQVTTGIVPPIALAVLIQRKIVRKAPWELI
jgi:hypothetical protein